MEAGRHARHAYKKTVYREVSEVQADGKIKKTHTATEVLETNITTIEPDGTITPITGNELETFLLRWTTQLTEIIANKYPPSYTFDYQSGPYAAVLDNLSKGRRHACVPQNPTHRIILKGWRMRNHRGWLLLEFTFCLQR